MDSSYIKGKDSTTELSLHEIMQKGKYTMIHYFMNDIIGK
jgi:hypothetical protein